MVVAVSWGAVLVAVLIVLEIGIAFYYGFWFVSSIRAARANSGDSVDLGMAHTNAAQFSKKTFYIALLWAIHRLVDPMPEWLTVLLSVGVIIDFYFAGSITYLMGNLLKARIAAAKRVTNEQK